MMILCRICEMVGLPAYSLTWWVIFRATVRYVSAILAGLAVIVIYTLAGYLIVCAIYDLVKYLSKRRKIK